MVKKSYEWEYGAVLYDHTARKHKILREYFFNYLKVRCSLPQQTKFRLAVIDGFSGAGRYKCGSPGSPLIFLEELKNAFEQITINRRSQGMSDIEIECSLIFNDMERGVIEILKEHCAPIIAEIKSCNKNLHINVQYMNSEFGDAYPVMREYVEKCRYSNVIYNLDQCGHSWVPRETVVDIMSSARSVEIILTFAIESLISFLKKTDKDGLLKQLEPFGFNGGDMSPLFNVMSKREWLGIAERLVFESFQKCAQFVSPFSINNEDGWRYWLIHFAKNYRARQVYNDVLHDNSSCQAHFGRSGLDMLAYEKKRESGALYLFNGNDQEGSKGQLIYDIPRFITASGDVMSVGSFYEQIYNTTPAHSDQINTAMLESPDVEVITDTGGKRRSIKTIKPDDYIKIKDQKSFFPLF